jgi:hypothetical protein
VAQPFLSAALSVPIKDKGFVGATYYFSFKTANIIPSGGSVKLTFPTEYSLLSSYPQPTFAAP